jgi:hypothetical protein
MGEDESTPGDTMRGRVPGSRLRLWLLLRANRWGVTAVVLAALFVGLVALGALTPASFAGGDPVETYFQALVTAIVTGVTLVVSINQMVLSQELGAVGDQRERMEDALQFRSDAADTVEAPVSPPEPAAFLRALVEATRSRAHDLEAAVEDNPDDEFRTRTTDYADSLREHADEVGEELENTQFGTFDVVFAALDFNYSWKVYEARRLRGEHVDALDDTAADALDAAIETLETFGPAREHFKTLYFQWALIDLSRAMLYAAVPALVVAGSMVLFVNVPAFPGATLGVANITWMVAAAGTVSLIPFAVLFAYVLRIATVAKRTLAIGPFVLRETERTDDINWDA